MSLLPALLPTMSLQTSPFLERLIRFLIPFFIGVTPDPEAARAEILETLASYGARTRAELLNAAQTVALGMSSLDMLHEAKTADMSPSMRLRVRGCANTLMRNSQKQEQTLTKRLASDLPTATTPPAEPVNDVPDQEVEISLEEVRGRLDVLRDRFLDRDTATEANEGSDQSGWDSKSMLATLAAEVGLPIEALTPIGRIV